MKECIYFQPTKSIYYLAFVCKNIKSMWHNSFVNDEICINCPVKELKEKGDKE